MKFKPLLPALLLAVPLFGCPSDPKPLLDVGFPDMGVDAGPGVDMGPGPDMGPMDGGDITQTCNNPALTPPASGTCTHTPGSSGATLLRGNIVAPGGLLKNGQVLIGADGKILCTECDCSAQPGFDQASVIECANGLISPGLINTHDHITFTETPPTPPSDPNEIYDHRHEWRRGQNGRERIPSVRNEGGASGVSWGELRNLMAGATSINGSGSASGLLRNLDRGNDNEGLNQPDVEYSTFPLGDTGGERVENGCGYPSFDRADDSAIAGSIAYAPHIAEGIDITARNEFLCLSSDANGGSDVLFEKTAVIHGIGLLPIDFAAMAAEGASLIWSPRSNIDLYGHTAQVALAKNVGVRIALGTDWTASGSMNMLRELRCADDLNQRNFGGFFTDRDLIDMATWGAASALNSEANIGVLAPGREADITIWNAATNADYRAILDAGAADVVLVMRSGLALYGDQDLMSGLPNTQTGCEGLDVCGVQKSVCSERETGMNIAGHQSAIAANAYDLFFCGEPPMEPTCVPFRVGEFMGMSSPGDRDGDGVMDMVDNCPDMFNPVRPLDSGNQADGDGDTVGDACDPCPLEVGTMGCTPPDPNDLDGDGVVDTMDNCPGLPNMDQLDGDMDMIGDLCDACPMESNLGGVPCSGTVYQVKQGEVTGSILLRNMLVTAVAPAGFFVQTITGDPSFDPNLAENFSGLFVFTSAAGDKPARGDRIDLSGDIGDFFGQTQLSNSQFTVLSSDNPMPAPIMVMPGEVTTGGLRADALEGVLVRVDMVSVVDVMPPVGPGDSEPTNEFVVQGGLRVNDLMYLVEPFPQVNDQINFIQGILRFANDNSKLEPRDALDLGADAALAGFTPDQVYIPAGGQPTGGLQVALNRPAEVQTTIDLSSDNPEVVVPAQVMIDMGQTAVDVQITANTPLMTPATLTATYDGAMATARVFVYDDAQARQIDDLSLDNTTLPIDGSTMGTITLDLPGAVGGTTVNLSVMPAGLGVVPATITVPEGAFSATFMLTAGMNVGNGSVTADAGAGPVSIGFQVNMSVSRPPMPGDLVITEIFRNPRAPMSATGSGSRSSTPAPTRS